MKTKISLLVISKKGDKLLQNCLDSCKALVDETVIVYDNTLDLGKKRQKGLQKTKNEWVLVLDTDEILSKELQREIVSLFRGSMLKNGYLIPFQNHFLGKPINYGGENYKMLRLFKKNSVEIKPALVHEGFRLKSGIPGELKNKIFHYSYRSLSQMFSKFTDYSIREAKQKMEAQEKPSFIKIFSYPIHMFWARFIKDKGYKDGLFRAPLDIGFAYMEMMTYVLLWLYSPGNSKLKNKSAK